MIDDYHGKLKMILNENDALAMSLSRFTVNKKKDTKESHLLNCLCFKMPSYEMLSLIFMGVEMVCLTIVF